MRIRRRLKRSSRKSADTLHPSRSRSESYHPAGYPFRCALDRYRDASPAECIGCVQMDSSPGLKSKRRLEFNPALNLFVIRYFLSRKPRAGLHFPSTLSALNIRTSNSLDKNGYYLILMPFRGFFPLLHVLLGSTLFPAPGALRLPSSPAMSINIISPTTATSITSNTTSGLDAKLLEATANAAAKFR